MSKIPKFEKPDVSFIKNEKFRVKTSQIPPMDVAFSQITLTDYELLVATIRKLNELVAMTNSYTEFIEKILEWVVNDGVELAVKEKLEEWLEDGTLENLINDTLFQQKLDKDIYYDFIENVYNVFVAGIDVRINDLTDDINLKADKVYVDDLNETVTTQLEQTNTDITSQWLNVMTPPDGFSVPTADGITDDSEHVNDLINYAYSLPHKPAVVIPESLGIAQSIICKEGVDLVFTNNATLTARADVNVIVMARNMTLKRPRIYVGEVSRFSHAAIFVHGNQYIKTMVQRTVIDNPIIWGEGEGYGIHIYTGDVSNQAVSYLQTLNPYIHRFYKGVFIEDSGISGTWANGNVFTNVLMSGNVNDLWVEKEGNIFDVVEIQPQSNVEKEHTLYCSGRNNSFTSLFLWDSHYGAKIKLSETTVNNTISIIAGAHPRSVDDLGEDNHITYSSRLSFKNNQIVTSRSYDVRYNNILNLAHKRYTFEQVSGPSPSAYQIENITTPGKETRWNLQGAGKIELEVTFDSVKNGFIAMGIATRHTPKSVKIEVYNESSSSWITWYENNNNRSNNIYTSKFWELSTHANNVKKIKYTLGASQTGGEIAVEDIWAFNKNVESEFRYLSTNGGIVYGKVLADEGLGVGNFSASPTEGTEIGKFRVFDEKGSPIGYVPVFNS